ncbi:hypothetical protein THRCLA_05708, partial [Thraustotheca clavata]
MKIKREWLTMLLFDHAIYLYDLEHNCGFYNNLYVPEAHPYDNTLVLTRNIDPDHILRRFVTHISNGFADCFNSSAWREIDSFKPNVLGEWWLTSERDEMNVPDVRLFFSQQVECTQREMNYNIEANYCLLWRQFFSEFDDRGIADDIRLQYVENFMNWLNSIVQKLFTRVQCPCIFQDSKIRVLQNCLPTSLIESLYLMATGYQLRMSALKSHSVNVEYDANADKNLQAPIFNERFASSMNVEETFSSLNAIQRREGR